MDKVESIRKIIRKSGLSSKIEVIDVPNKGGNKIVLLRPKQMPEVAFILWANVSTGTQSQLSIKMPYDGYSQRFSVVCACSGCEPEISGRKIPENADKRAKWRRILTKEFKRSVISTCKKSGISQIIIRHADEWEHNYGASSGITAIESTDMDRFFTMSYLTERGVSKDVFDFIDYRNSKGIGGPINR